MRLETSLKLLEMYETDRTIQNFIAQANSRYILYTAKEPIDNFPNYSINLDEKCLHISFSYLNLGWSFFFYKETDKAFYCIEKAAGIIEHLYAFKDCQKSLKEYYGMVCGLSYYISSQYSKSFIVLKYYSSNNYLSQLFKYFLTRDFIRLESLLNEVQLSVDYIAGHKDDEVRIYEKIFSDALLQMMIFINTGNRDSIEKSKAIMFDLIELAKINEEPHMWWIFRLFYLVIEEYSESSLWTILPSIISDSEILGKYVFANRYKQNPIVELFKSQRKCVLDSMAKDDSFAVGMPTSSGKTKIAELAILKTLSNQPNSICIYIAPFRSLELHFEQLRKIMLQINNGKSS